MKIKKEDGWKFSHGGFTKATFTKRDKKKDIEIDKKIVVDIEDVMNLIEACDHLGLTQGRTQEEAKKVGRDLGLIDRELENKIGLGATDDFIDLCDGIKTLRDKVKEKWIKETNIELPHLSNYWKEWEIIKRNTK